VKSCPEDCKRHHRKPCPPDCVSHVRWCPLRHGDGLVEVDVKSSAGRRGIVPPDRLYDLLMTHEERQANEREHGGSEWHGGEWMFTSRTGSRSTRGTRSARETAPAGFGGGCFS
jgi:hypothetical protein